MTCTLQTPSTLKDTEMSYTEAKSNDAPTAQTAQQHHLQAAEHLEQAAQSHKEAAKLTASGEHKGVQIHVEKAKTHTAKATEHMMEAEKKSATSPAAVNT